MQCVSCGRTLTNDVEAPNAANWTYASHERQSRDPYCAHSVDCQRDAEGPIDWSRDE